MTDTIKITPRDKVYDAMRVEDDNLKAVAEWCGGVVSNCAVRGPGVDVGTENEFATPGEILMRRRDGYFETIDAKTFKTLFEVVEPK